MWPFKKRTKIPTPQDAQLFEAPPADTSLRLLRRFGHVNNLGVSGSQFNIYRHTQGGYILRMQDDSGESDHLGHIPAGTLLTFQEAYERIMGYFTDHLILSPMMGGPYSQEFVFDTTPGQGRQYVSILTANNGSVQENRYQHGSDLLAGIFLPPPPPSERRFYQFFTKEGENAVKQRAGRLYDLFVQDTLKMNPECFDGEGALQIMLRRMVWPPEPFEDFFGDFPHIPRIVTHIRPDPDGDWIPFFETDLQRHFVIFASRASFKRAFVEQFGDVDGYRKFKAKLVAEGGSVEQFEETLRSKAEEEEKQRFRPQ